MTTTTISEELEGYTLLKVSTTFDRPVRYLIQKPNGTRTPVKGGLEAGQALLLKLAL